MGDSVNLSGLSCNKGSVKLSSACWLSDAVLLLGELCGE
jgi:hypothetical protein